MFFTLFLLFARFLPMIAISEVKGVRRIENGTPLRRDRPLRRSTKCPAQIDIEQIKDKLGIGEDKVYAVMGDFDDARGTGHGRAQDSRDGLYQAGRHDAVSGAWHRRRPRAFRIRSWAGS